MITLIVKGMTSSESHTSMRNHNRSFPLPDMGPFAGLLFLLICPIMLSGEMRMPAVATVADEQLPLSHPQSVCGMREPFGSVIGLDSNNRLSFAMPETSKEFQVVVLNKVAGSHGMQLTASQLTTLKNLPFLATDIQQLPQTLALPSLQRDRLLQSGKFGSLSQAQLAECITAARTLLKQNNKFYYIGIKIDAEAKMSHVISLTDLLERQGINRFQLITRYKAWKKDELFTRNH